MFCVYDVHEQNSEWRLGSRVKDKLDNTRQNMLKLENRIYNVSWVEEREREREGGQEIQSE